jgi:membrane protein DedA with SNARE-associated domain
MRGKRAAGTRRSRASRATRRWRTPLTVVLGLRAVLGLVAIPLAPVLYEDHFVLLVLIRPTKEVLLAGGFLVRQGEVNLLALLLATIPMLFVGVWLFFALGRGYRKEIAAGDVPGLGGRVLPMKRVAAIRKVLDKKGVKLVVLGRLAAAPSTLFAATAGASRMSSRQFLVADTAGALLSLVEVIGAGLLLGEAYHEAGRWITVAGVAVLLGLLWLFGRYLRRE